MAGRRSVAVARRREPLPKHRQGFASSVVSEVPKQKTVRRLDRLDSAWIQESPTPVASPALAFDEGFEVVENPSRRSRTPLTDKEVEAIRTARASGESVLSIAKRFNVHRATVWEYTRGALRSEAPDGLTI